MITAPQLVAATGCSAANADRWAGPLSAAADEFSIRNPAHWIAQCAHESARFSRTAENLYYTSPDVLRRVFGRRIAPAAAAKYLRAPEVLANHVYADRLGNGGPASGDGWAFRGSGLIQLTGRANFARYTADTGVPALEQPDLVRGERAAHAAAWFWVASGCHEVDDVAEITRRINGPARLGLAERVALTRAALESLA